jgi:UDP-N-acetylglucosamine 1-carboxyvinyltransferase
MTSSEHLMIEGTGGARSLVGTIKTGGAKNAVLKVLAATILFQDSVHLKRVPEIEDVRRMLELLSALGAEVTHLGPNEYSVNASQLKGGQIPADISKKMRSSIVLIGPLLARYGSTTFPHPGGCVIGKRPIDLFLTGFEKMGVTISEADDLYHLQAPAGGLQGANIFFKNQSVTATETFLLAATLAKGQTVLKNCALEPEIVSLGEYLIKGGAKISGLGTSTITIEGVSALKSAGQIYQTMPDRIEAGSFLVLAALAAADVTIADCEPKHLEAVINFLTEAGVNLEIGSDFIRVRDKQPAHFQAGDLKTHEYPGFPTDLQAPLAIFLTQAQGQSFIFETIFEGRLNYLEALGRLGVKAKILDAHRAIIDGPTELSGKELESPDLRAGLAYVIAGIIAKGRTLVHNVEYIDRGYEQLEQRLRRLGVEIERVAAV